MEESTTYTLQEIEKLKLKISGYRNTLMTLKMGTSFEDFQMMKNEFEALKSQLTYIEDLTKTMEEKQHTQNIIYEEQAKQFELQIASLNKTVEKMGKEIVLISMKLNNVKEEKVEEEEKKKEQPLAEKSSAPKPASTMKYIHNGTPENVPPPALPNQPSYMQMRNLANQVIQLQNEEEKSKPEDHIEYKTDQVDERYFNQRYFQTINHQTHQNVNRNSLNKASLKSNKSSKSEAAFLPNSNKASHTSEPVNKAEETTTSLTKNVTESSIVSPELHEVEFVNEKLQTDLSDLIEVSSMKEDTQPENFELLIEESVDNKDSGEEKTKKQWNSSFFNIFRK